MFGPPLVLLVAVFVLLHGVRTIGVRRLTVLLLASGATGFAAEVVSLRFGTLFGSQYIYPPEMWTGGILLGVPLAIPMFWSVYIYIGYSVVNSFVLWIGGEAPRRHRNNGRLLPLLLLADGIVVVAMDLFMDPLLAYRGNWVWAEKGAFFGVPVGNFAGWFMVTVLSTIWPRGWEYFFPREPTVAADTLRLMPVMAYAILAAGFAFYAAWIGEYALAVVGIFSMGLVVILNLLCFAVRDRTA